MHATVLDFVKRTLTAEHVAGKSVLEVGSADVNGSARPIIQTLGPAEYLGVDAAPGRGVDAIVDCEDLADQVGLDWDLVASFEMLEHVRNWNACMRQLAEVIAPGGWLVITTRSPGFPYHPYPEDHWRYTNYQMRDIIDALGLELVIIENDPEPGVFVLARKPDDWVCPAQDGILDRLPVDRVVP